MYLWENNLLMFLFLLLIVDIMLFLYLTIFSKNKISNLKKTCFECGIDSWSANENYFSMRFFFIGMIFLIFDIEIIIMFPFFLNLKFYFFMLIIVLIIYSLFYEWVNNSLIWK